MARDREWLDNCQEARNENRDKIAMSKADYVTHEQMQIFFSKIEHWMKELQKEKMESLWIRKEEEKAKTRGERLREHSPYTEDEWGKQMQ